MSIAVSKRPIRATFGGRELRLNRVSAIDAPTAGALCQWSGRELHLHGVESLDDVSARRFADFDGQVFFESEKAAAAYLRAKDRISVTMSRIEC